MNAFSLSIFSAEKPFFEGECISLVFPTVDGLYGIQAGHDNMIAAIVPGELKFMVPSGEITYAAVSNGLVKVENGKVLILVDTAERPEEIDENLARHSMEEAKEAILQKKSIQDYYAAQGQMARAVSRLRVKSHEGGH